MLPRKAATDAARIAIATVHGMDFPLTWNWPTPLECGSILRFFRRELLTARAHQIH